MSPFSFSDRVRTLRESTTIMMSRLSREKAERGESVINLSLGEPDFNTPSHIRAAAKAAIDAGYSHYPPVSGYAELKAAIIDKYEREQGIRFQPEQVVVSTGAKQALANLFQIVLNPGDRVVAPAPYWVSYFDMVTLAGGTFVPVPAGAEADYKITAEQLDTALSEAPTRMVILNSPSNPTGMIYTREEMGALAEVLAKHPEVFIISDEIYDWLAFDGELRSMAPFTALHDRLAIVNGVSKSYAMTGWRIGYFIGPPAVARMAEKFQGQFTSGACSISQQAAIAALSGDHGPTIAMREAFRQRRDAATAILDTIPGVKYARPQGAMYVFIDIRELLRQSDFSSSLDFALWFLERHNVSTVPGEAFGMPGHLRISFAADIPTLTSAIHRLADACQSILNHADVS